jgi:CRISPR/Cas system-associated endonuclease/helicase Cas3
LAWKWISIYAAEWGCYWVLASGSLCRFWEIPEINNGDTYDVPELVADALREKLSHYEKQRVTYHNDLVPKDTAELVAWITGFPGPRLVILNTVQSAAVLAECIYKKYDDRAKVEHLSTALNADDREKTINRVKERLTDKNDTNWTFVATSCVEAGIDLSFRNGFREVGSFVSLLQASGRVNREGKYNDSEMWTFVVAENGFLKKHPLLEDAAAVLRNYLEDGETIAPELSTQSIQDEIRRQGISSAYKKLVDAENIRRFPEVEKDFKVINTDTRMVLVDEELIAQIERHEKVDWRELQKKSVMIWGYKLEALHIPEIRDGLYKWTLAYDDFLGYMAGLLTVEKIVAGEVCII